jgi:hypothetical protein
MNNIQKAASGRNQETTTTQNKAASSIDLNHP